jgi:hypothetical protein
MLTVEDVTTLVRSKVAGPFWVTIDIFFADRATYEKWHSNTAFSADTISQVYGVPAETVARYAVENLNMIKISYPRAQPQGGITERDLHSGQQFSYLMKVPIKVDT